MDDVLRSTEEQFQETCPVFSVFVIQLGLVVRILLFMSDTIFGFVLLCCVVLCSATCYRAFPALIFSYRVLSRSALGPASG